MRRLLHDKSKVWMWRTAIIFMQIIQGHYNKQLTQYNFEFIRIFKFYTWKFATFEKKNLFYLFKAYNEAYHNSKTKPENEHASHFAESSHVQTALFPHFQTETHSRSYFSDTGFIITARYVMADIIAFAHRPLLLRSTSVLQEAGSRPTKC